MHIIIHNRVLHDYIRKASLFFKTSHLCGQIFEDAKKLKEQIKRDLLAIRSSLG